MQKDKQTITTCQINKPIMVNLILVELISFGIHSLTTSMLCWSTKHAHCAATFQQLQNQLLLPAPKLLQMLPLHCNLIIMHFVIPH